jgi:nucleoid DNA-binding protein
LKQQDEVRIPQFGTFFVKKKEWRKSRDPRTGKEIMAPPRNLPMLDFSDFVKIPVNQSNLSLRPKDFQSET